nr:hypothetical protein [Streptomyces brasiliensis]
MADDPAVEPGRPLQALGESDVRGALGDVGDDRGGVDRGQYDLRGRAARSFLRAEGRQPTRQELLGDGQAGADPQPVTPVGPQSCDAGVHLGPDIQQPGSPLRDHDAFGGQSTCAGEDLSGVLSRATSQEPVAEPAQRVRPVGADSPVTCAELRLQGYDVITSRVFASPSALAWKA